jgi:hypothetical protein
MGSAKVTLYQEVTARWNLDLMVQLTYLFPMYAIAVQHWARNQAEVTMYIAMATKVTRHFMFHMLKIAVAGHVGLSYKTFDS